MNTHLQLVREYLQTITFPEEGSSKAGHLSDMDIIFWQALLMESGADTLKALKAGDMAHILCGLANSAYISLCAVAHLGSDVSETDTSWRHDGFVLSVMQLISNKINDCRSGKSECYSEVYGMASVLSSSFLNADFNAAVNKIHLYQLQRFQQNNRSIYSDFENQEKIDWSHNVDLSDCLFE